MRKVCLPLFLISASIFLSIALISPARAQTVIFQDDFNDNNISDWTVARNMQWANPSQPCLYKGTPTAWEAKDGRAGVKIDGPGCVTELIPSSFNIAEGLGYSYTFDMEFTGSVFHDRNVIFKYLNPSNWYDFKFYGPTLWMQKVVDSYYRLETTSYPFEDNQTYAFRIDFADNKIKLFINGIQIWELEDSLPYFSGGTVGLQASVGADPVSEVWFDNVVVTSVGEPEADPAILLLGLGASWNKDALICNAEVGWEDWEMTPGIHHYDGIIQTFQQALGEDFHVFFYDWTKPVDQIADDLKTFIDEVVNPPPGTEIDLVGHSLGGLVARAYLQKNPADHGIDQLLTLGSPHQGVPQVYYAWEGANFKKLLHPLEAYGAMLLIFGRRGPLESLVEVVQDEMPSLKDLLPIFPYLKKDPTGEIIPLGSMSQRNKWLPGLFPILANLLPRFNPLIGLAGDTTRWLRVVPRSWGDNLRGMWEDGRPSGEEYEMGDKTVLAESAGLDGASNTELSGLNHSELVTTVAGQEAVLDLLGITGVSPTPGATDFSTRAFVAALLPLVCPLAEASIASPPVGIRIIDPLGQTAGEGVPTTIPEAIYRPEDQLILIPGALEGNYQVEVVGNPGEDYHLVIGELGEAEDIWVDQREEIGSEGVDSYPTEFSQDAEEIEQNLLHLAKTKLQELQDWLASYPNTRVYRTIRQVIGTTIRMIEGAERYLEKNKTGKAKTSLRAAVLLIGTGQKYVPKFESAGLIPAEVAEKILFETTQSRDYLLQTLEILGE